MYRLNRNIEFNTPEHYTFSKMTNENGQEITVLKFGNRLNPVGEMTSEFECQIIEFDCNSPEGSMFSDMEQWVHTGLQQGSGIRYAQIQGKYPCVLSSMETPINYWGTTLKMYALRFYVIYRKTKAIMLVALNQLDENDQDLYARNYGYLVNLLESVRIDGETLNLKGLNADQLEKALTPDFLGTECCADVTDDLYLTSDDEKKLTNAGISEVQSKKKIPTKTPDVSLYPHYNSIKNNPLAELAARSSLVSLNENGMEYEFQSLRELKNDTDLNAEKRDLLERILKEDTEYYDLDQKAMEMIPLYHVTPDSFDPKHDRECELLEGYMHKAYMMSAIRSFAWTAGTYCNQMGQKIEDLSSDLVWEIADFAADRDWLNFEAGSCFQGLCSGSDLHVYFIPDTVAASDKRKLEPTDEEKAEIARIRASFPGFRDIPAEVHSLNALRRDLKEIYPAIFMLWERLRDTRQNTKPLLGNQADVVYAWCALALAAKGPFYTEDGPMNCSFQQQDILRQEKKRKSSDIHKKTPNQSEIKNIWTEKYEKYLETDPYIEVQGNTFAFSGFDTHIPEKYMPAIEKLIDKGGFYQGQISDWTDYFVVDPDKFNDSKMNAVVAWRENGKGIKIILMSDLESALNQQPLKVHDNPEDSISPKNETGNRKQKNCCKYAMEGSYYEDSSEYRKYQKYIMLEPEIHFEESKFVFCGISSLKQEKEHPLVQAVLEKGGLYRANISKTTDYLIYNPVGGTTTKLEQARKLNEDGGHIKIILLQHLQKALGLPETVKSLGSEHKDRFDLDSHRTLTAYHGNAWKVFIPCGTVKIGNSALKGIDANFIQIPEGVIEIGDHAFQDCELLEKVILPNTLKIIGAHAFENCKNLHEMIIPDNVVTIREHAFSNSGLKSLDLPPLLNCIPSNMIFDCENLHHIVIPEGVSIIKEEAFAFSHLESISMPCSLRVIEKEAFQSCMSLKNILISEGLETIESFAFDCWCYDSSAICHVYLPESLENIARNAFLDGENFFFHVSPESTAESYVKEHGFQYDDRPIGEKEDSPELILKRPDVIYENHSKDFIEENENSIDIVIPNNIREIGNDAFSYCDADNIFFSKTVSIIGTFSFSNCNSLEKVIIPGNIKKIGAFAFFNCENLRKVVIEEGVEEIGEDCFDNCINLQEISLPHSIQKIFPRAFAQCGLQTLILPDNLKIIEDELCIYCSSLKTVELPPNMRILGSNAFAYCGLENIKIPEKTEVIEERAFYGCKGLEKAVFLKKVESVAEDAFSACPHLDKNSIQQKSTDKTIARDDPDLSEIMASDTAEGIDLLPDNGEETDPYVTSDLLVSLDTSENNEALCRKEEHSVSTKEFYTITYDVNGGTGIIQLQKKEARYSVILSYDVPVRENYRFLGWAEKSDSMKADYRSGDIYSKDQNIILYAVWEKAETTKIIPAPVEIEVQPSITYQIHYDVCGGEQEIQSTSKQVGHSVPITFEVPTKSGFIFLGWRSRKNGPIDYRAGDLYSKDEDLVLYAVWEKQLDESEDSTGKKKGLFGWLSEQFRKK